MDDTDLALVIELAALAPSVHNTQPWRLELAGDRVLVRADRSRQLTRYLDRDARQLHISCGAAIEFARLAIRRLGRRCEVQLRPDPDDPDLLGVLVAGAAAPPTDREQALADAIPRRYTDRLPYSPAPVRPDTFADLRAAAAAAGAWLRVVDDPDDRVALVVILAESEAREATDPAYAAELAEWTRPAGADGLAAAALEQWPADVVSDVPLRDFSGHGVHPRPTAGAPPRVAHDALVLVGTDRDGPVDWLIAGRAIGSVLLHATEAGLAAQPLGPATDTPDARERVRQELHLVGHPQFLLRLGYGHDRPHTRRRTGSGELAEA